MILDELNTQGLMSSAKNYTMAMNLWECLGGEERMWDVRSPLDYQKHLIWHHIYQC